MESAAYAAAPSVVSGFGARSSRTTRCTRISVTDFFAPSLATYTRVWISPIIWRCIPFVKVAACSAVRPYNHGEEKHTANQFFQKVLRPKDMAFVISFGSEAELLQDYTNSLKLLREGLEGLRLNTSVSGIHPGPVPNSPQRGTIMFDAVFLAAADKLKSEVGRNLHCCLLPLAVICAYGTACNTISPWNMRDSCFYPTQWATTTQA